MLLLVKKSLSNSPQTVLVLVSVGTRLNTDNVTKPLHDTYVNCYDLRKSCHFPLISDSNNFYSVPIQCGRTSDCKAKAQGRMHLYYLNDFLISIDNQQY